MIRGTYPNQPLAVALLVTVSKKHQARPTATASDFELTLEGEVTIASLEALQPAFVAALQQPGSLWIRTSTLTYLDAAALQFLWAMQRDCLARHQELRIERPAEPILKSARLLGMQEVFEHGSIS